MHREDGVEPRKESERSQDGQEKLHQRGAKGAREEETRTESDRAQKEQQQPLRERAKERDRPHSDIQEAGHMHEPRNDLVSKRNRRTDKKDKYCEQSKGESNSCRFANPHMF